MVSVTIVTWNSAQYLGECFASIEQQDYRELEVIIVDNASRSFLSWPAPPYPSASRE